MVNTSNVDRTCYEEVMNEFDNETRLIRSLQGIFVWDLKDVYLWCRTCPCGVDCKERQFLSRVLSILFIIHNSHHFSVLDGPINHSNPTIRTGKKVLNKVTTSTWPSGQYWQSLALEFFDANDLKVNFLKLNAYVILSVLWDEQKNVGVNPWIK